MLFDGAVHRNAGSILHDVLLSHTLVRLHKKAKVTFFKVRFTD